MTVLPCLLVTLGIAASVDQYEGARGAAERVNSAYQKYNSPEFTQLLRPSYFGNEFEKRVAGYRGHLKKIEEFEQKEVPALKKVLEKFEGSYGSNIGDIRKRIQEIKGDGGSIPGDPAYAWEKLNELTVAPTALRRKLAAELMQYGSKGGQTHQGYDILTVEESYAQAKRYLELAVAYQPDLAEAQQMLSQLEGNLETQLAEGERETDAAQFPPHSASFQGPGSVDDIAKVATRYLQSKESGKDGKLLALRIAGDWQVADQNILGDTLTWGLPVEVAYKIDGDAETAKVVSVELITRGTAQEPPFQRHRFFESRQVRVANLPRANAASGFSPLRLLLALMLVVLGLIAAAPLIELRLPWAAAILSPLQPLGPALGVATLAVGAVSLGLSVFSPWGDVLPQSAAIVVGLVMGLDLLLKHSPAKTEGLKGDLKGEHTTAAGQIATKAGDVAIEAVTKAQTLLAENQTKIRSLRTFRVPLGVSCLTLGLLHLTVGSWVLF